MKTFLSIPQSTSSALLGGPQSPAGSDHRSRSLLGGLVGARPSDGLSDRPPSRDLRRRAGLGAWAAALALALAAHGPWSAQAGVPEPDTVLFGSIALNGVGVTAADTGVTVEMRATPTGPVLASYRMGSSPAAGNRYVLRVKNESAAPLLESDAVALGATVYLTVRDGTGTRAEATHTLTQRGTFVRIDFGALDTDGDGMSDAFEQQNFGSATGGDPNADPDGDGRPNRREALQGTNPLVADGQHPADINPANWSLNIQEITEYALAWKLGQAWSIEPATIPANYVTRAAALWVSGENYVFDNVPATTAPLWWVPAPVVAAAAAAPQEFEANSNPAASQSLSETETLRRDLVSSARAARAEVQLLAAGTGRSGAAPQSPRVQPSVSRALPASYTVLRPFQVSLTVQPGGDTRAFAVEETPPAGWLVRFVSGEGRYDSKNQKIKWGPFYGAEARTLTYELTPLVSKGTAAFAGAGSFDGSGVTVEGSVAIQPPGAGGIARLEVTRAPGNTGSVGMELTASPGSAFWLEASPDFATWSQVREITADSQGRAAFETQVSAGARFFRLRTR